MELNLYSIFDNVTHTHGNFFFSPNDADAIRRAKQAFKDNPFVKDFVLYALAKVSTDDGVVESLKSMFIGYLVDEVE